MSNRKSQGVTLAFIAFCALVVVVIGAAFFIISMMIGGNRELRNATDSGNLNVALQSLGKPVYLNSIADPTGIAAQQFVGLGSNGSYANPEIDLNTFNRASAVALMVASNAQAMGNQQALADAQTVVTAWQNVSTALAGVLRTQSTFNNDFANLASGNSIRMLNGQVNDINTQSSFAVGYTDKGQGASSTVGGANVYFINGQLLSNNAIATYLMTAPKSVSLSGNTGNNFVFPQGYVPFALNAGQVFFVPLKDTGNNWQYFNNSQPHLINSLVFDQFTKTPASWTGAVPNSFQSGSTTNESLQNNLIKGAVGGQAPNLTMNTISSAVTFSLTTFQAQIPTGFMIIRNDTGQCTKIGGQCVNALGIANQSLIAQRAAGDSPASLSGTYQSGVGNVVLDRGPLTNCTNSSSSSYVTDYGQGVTMNNLVMGPAQAGYNAAFYNALVQRCYQMYPDFNGNLASIPGWSSTNIAMGGVAYLYFNGSVNASNGKITGNLIISIAPPPWVTQNTLTQISNRTGTDALGFGTYQFGADGNTQYYGLASNSVLLNVDIDRPGDCGYGWPYTTFAAGCPIPIISKIQLIGGALNPTTAEEAEIVVNPLFLNNGLEYKPSSGYLGLLGEIDLISCFGSTNATVPYPSVTEVANAVVNMQTGEIPPVGYACGLTSHYYQPPLPNGQWQYQTTPFSASATNSCTFSGCNAIFSGPC